MPRLAIGQFILIIPMFHLQPKLGNLKTTINNYSSHQHIVVRVLWKIAGAVTIGLSYSLSI